MRRATGELPCAAATESSTARSSRLWIRSKDSMVFGNRGLARARLASRRHKPNFYDLGERRSPRAQQWSFGVEREWREAFSVGVDVNYVRGSDLLLPLDANAPSFFDYTTEDLRSSADADSHPARGTSWLPRPLPDRVGRLEPILGIQGSGHQALPDLLHTASGLSVVADDERRRRLPYRGVPAARSGKARARVGPQRLRHPALLRRERALGRPSRAALFRDRPSPLGPHARSEGGSGSSMEISSFASAGSRTAGFWSETAFAPDPSLRSTSPRARRGRSRKRAAWSSPSTSST